MTTWAELRKGNKILDKSGNTWTVRETPQIYDRHYCLVPITNGTQYVNVTRNRNDEAPLVEIPEELEEIVDNVVSIESAREAAVRTGPPPRVYPLAPEMGGLKLRSHLYLLHGHTPVTQLSDVDEMVTVHVQLHGDKVMAYDHWHGEEER